MAITNASPRPAMATESPAATPTFCHTARPGSSSSQSITSAIPSLTSSADSNSIGLSESAPTNGWTHSSSFHQLDANGYPTQALYHLHKKMLEIALYPQRCYNQPWWLWIRPGTPVPSPPLEVNDGGIVAPDNSLDEVNILSVLGEIKQVRSMEEDLVLHNLCATLISADYRTPPTPPVGATPCDTPPEFNAPAYIQHDEFACLAARVLLSSGGMGWEMMDQLLDGYRYEDALACPCDKNEHKKTLLEEMEECTSKTPRDTKQTRRRARNSSKRVAREVVIEAF